MRLAEFLKGNPVAGNLVSLVMEFMTPDRVECIAATVGLDRNIAQSAVSASVPGLLAALSGIALQPGGAQKLAEAAERQSDTLGSFAGLLSDRGQIEKGSRMLSWLLGGGHRYALTGAIGEFMGLSRRASGSLLGMLIPVVMGTIAQQRRGCPLNADGVAGLLAAQKENITGALPPGFGNLLVGGGLLCSTGSDLHRELADDRYREQGGAWRRHIFLAKRDGDTEKAARPEAEQAARREAWLQSARGNVLPHGRG